MPLNSWLLALLLEWQDCAPPSPCSAQICFSVAGSESPKLWLDKLLPTIAMPTLSYNNSCHIHSSVSKFFVLFLCLFSWLSWCLFMWCWDAKLGLAHARWLLPCWTGPPVLFILWLLVLILVNIVLFCFAFFDAFLFFLIPCTTKFYIWNSSWDFGDFRDSLPSFYWKLVLFPT